MGCILTSSWNTPFRRLTLEKSTRKLPWRESPRFTARSYNLREASFGCNQLVQWWSITLLALPGRFRDSRAGDAKRAGQNCGDLLLKRWSKRSLLWRASFRIKCLTGRGESDSSIFCTSFRWAIHASRASQNQEHGRIFVTKEIRS